MRINMSQMESVTEQNSANAEESASAAEKLSAQSENLKQIVRELSQLVNGNVATDKKFERIANCGADHLTHQGISNSHLNFAHWNIDPIVGANLISPADKTDKKTKAVSPEDVIPLEKDPYHF